MVVKEYEFEGEFIDILPLGDLHIGSPESYFDEAIKLLDVYPDTKVVFLGDLLDNAIINSVGDVYSQDINPHEAFKGV